MLNSMHCVPARHVWLGTFFAAILISAVAIVDVKAQRVQEGDLTRSIGELRLRAKAVIGDAELSTPQHILPVAGFFYAQHQLAECW